MTIKNLNKFDSVINLKGELQATYKLIRALEAQTIATQEFLNYTKAKTRPDYEKFKDLLEVDPKQIDKLYELGFVAFFSNFECFMFEFLKELFVKYPESYSSDKVATYDDVKDFSNVEEVKEYFIDAFAINKSYEIKEWKKFLLEKFNIKVFKDDKQGHYFNVLNSIRNIIQHSGNKTNSKFRNEMKRVIKSLVPIGQKTKLDSKKNFDRVFTLMSKLLQNIEEN